MRRPDPAPTPAQLATYDYIVDHVHRLGFQPTQSEIADALGRPRRTVYNHVRRLAQAGLIILPPGQVDRNLCLPRAFPGFLATNEGEAVLVVSAMPPVPPVPTATPVPELPKAGPAASAAPVAETPAVPAAAEPPVVKVPEEAATADADDARLARPCPAPARRRRRAVENTRPQRLQGPQAASSCRLAAS